jgi:hypothetical protein
MIQSYVDDFLEGICCSLLLDQKDQECVEAVGHGSKYKNSV